MIPAAKINRTAAGEESGGPPSKDEDRFVLRGPAWQGADHLAVVSEKSAAYHRRFISAVESATTTATLAHGPPGGRV